MSRQSHSWADLKMEKVGQQSTEDQPAERAELSQEIFDKIMTYLDTKDLKACRLVSKVTTGEATRALFRVIRVDHSRKSLDNARMILRQPDFGRYARGLEYDARGYIGDDPNHHNKYGQVLMSLGWWDVDNVALTQMRPEHVDGTALSTLPIICFYRVKDFSLIAACPMYANEPIFPNLVERLPQVVTMTLGMSAEASWSAPALFPREARMCRSLLQGTFPRLTKLTLQNIINDKQASVTSFLKRHAATLKIFEIERATLEVPHKIEPDMPRNELMAIMQFVLWLHDNMQLEHMSFSKSLWAISDNLRRLRRHVGILFCDASTCKAPNVLKSRVEDFVCHRGEFSFEELRGRQDLLRRGQMVSFNREYVTEGELKTIVSIKPERDETWVLVN